MELLLFVLLSVILPPAAVALKKGIGGAFAINILLTLIGWLPGVIHALFVVFADRSTTAHA